MISVLLRVAGSPSIGFGHVRRSWTLAEHLREAGARVRFVASSRAALGVLRGAGFEASAEEEPPDDRVTLRTLHAMAGPRVCVVDDPTLPAAVMERINEGAPTACLDDTALRVLPVDIVVNGSAGAGTLAYRGSPHTRFLLGPDYIVLRRVFATAPRRWAAEQVTRVLLLTGGGANDVGGPVLDAIRRALPLATIDVVVGPFGTVPVQTGARDRVRVHVAPSDIASLMAAADLAVTGGGQTAYELAAMGTPALGIQLASNQTVNLHGLDRAGCLRDLGTPDASGFLDRLGLAICELAGDCAARARMTELGQRLVDGCGAARVADAVGMLARHSAVGCGV